METKIIKRSSLKKFEYKNGMFIFRYGIKQVNDNSDECTCVERVFMKRPPVDRINEIIDTYNKENGINEVFNPQDYGY